VKDLRRPEELLKAYVYNPSEGLSELGFRVFLPSATYEHMSEEEARRYNVLLSAENRVYVRCKVGSNVYSVTGIGWNESAERICGFEVSEAEYVRAVRTGSGWLTSRSKGWVCRSPK